MLSGYSTSLFTDSPPDFVKCTICFDVMRDPTQCTRGHAFCRCCILVHIRRKEKCPSCACDLRVQSLADNLVARNLIGTLTLICSTHDNEDSSPSDDHHKRQKVDCCSWSGCVDDLQSHLRNCEFVVMNCPNRDCEVSLAKRSLRQHDAECPHKLIPCDECGQLLKRTAHPDHMADCPSLSVICPNACGASFQRCERDQHLSQVCPLEVVDCPNIQTGCSSACSRHFRREELDAHLSNPVTMMCAIKNLTKTVTAMQSERRLDQKRIADLESMQCRLATKAFDIRWSAQPCEKSRAAIERQLIEEKSIPGSNWTTFHFSTELPIPVVGAHTVVRSPWVLLNGGAKACIEESRAEDSYFMVLHGFCGTVESVSKVLDFGGDFPVWESREVRTCENGGRWLLLNEVSRIRVLTTLHLTPSTPEQLNAAMIAYWQSIACEQSREVLSEQLSAASPPFDGREWSKYHMAYEFDLCCPEQRSSHSYSTLSLFLAPGVYFKMYVAQNEDIDIIPSLRDASGIAKIEVTFFRFGRGAPKQSEVIGMDFTIGPENILRGTAVSHISLSEQEVSSNDWSTPENRLRVLATVYRPL